MDPYGRRKLVAAILVFFLLIIGLIGEAMHDKTLRNRALAFLGMTIAGLVALVMLLALLLPANAHDHNRPDLNNWYHDLHAKGGSWCCDGSDFDTGSAKHLADVDWESRDGHYRVRLNGAWIDVPDEAVIERPNLDGRAMVWPYYLNGELVGIRCFMPGSMT